jgi:hypothetical protein
LRRVIFLFEASRWISSALFVFDKSGIKLITTAFIYNAEFRAASLYKPCKFLPFRIYFFEILVQDAVANIARAADWALAVANFRSDSWNGRGLSI